MRRPQSLRNDAASQACFLGLILLVIAPHVVRAAEPIESVRVEGVQSWERRDVVDRLGTLRRQGWETGMEQAWRDALLASGVYQDVEVQAREGVRGIEVVVSVRKRQRISAVEFEGNRALRTSRLQRSVRLLEGQAPDQKILEAGRARILKLYADEGFPATAVQFRFEPVDANLLKVRVKVDEGPQERIASIHWIGDWPGTHTQLQAWSGLERGQPWTRKRRDSARRALEERLRERGFLAAVVSLKGERLEDGAVDVFVSVKLGPRFEVHFEGNGAISLGRLRKLFESRRGPVVGVGFWERLRSRIRDEYEQAGYLGAQVSYEVAAPEPHLRLVTYRIFEGRAMRLCGVSFQGVREMPERALLDAMGSAWKSWKFWRKPRLTTPALEEALRRIWFLYHRSGFVEAQVLDRHVVIDWERGCVYLGVRIFEGTRLVVHELEVREWPAADLRVPKLETRIGEPLDEEKLERDRALLEQSLVEAGYREVAVDGGWKVLSQELPARVGIEFRVKAYPPAFAREVVVKGNFETRTRSILRAAGLQPNQRVTPASLAQARARVSNLGVFRNVEVRLGELHREAANPLDAGIETGAQPSTLVQRVAITVDERPPYSLSMGGGYSTRDGFRGFFEAAHGNLGHRAVRLAIRADAALDPAESLLPNEYLGDLSLRMPQAFGADWTFRGNLLAQRSTRSVDQFSIERLAFIPAVEWKGARGAVGGIELQAETARIFDIRPDVRNFNPRDEGRLSSLGLGPFFLLDRRDDPFAPSSGWSQNWRLRIVPDLPNSDVPLIKLQWQHSHYLPLGRGWSLVASLRAGWARTLTGEVVPLRERFFLGGRTTVRGFSENSIGPVGAPILDSFGRIVFPGGSPLGGDVSLNSNFELRFPLVGEALGVLFADGGGVYLQSRGVDLSGYRRSAGVGLLYRTPVGPLALHWGFKLDRRPGEDVGAVHFSIGAPF